MDKGTAGLMFSCPSYVWWTGVSYFVVLVVCVFLYIFSRDHYASFLNCSMSWIVGVYGCSRQCGIVKVGELFGEPVMTLVVCFYCSGSWGGSAAWTHTSSNGRQGAARKCSTVQYGAIPFRDKAIMVLDTSGGGGGPSLVALCYGWRISGW